MAKLIDKIFNRVIEGELLEISQEEKERLGLGGVKSEVIKADMHAIDADVLAYAVGTAEEYTAKLMSYDLLLFTSSLSLCIFIAPTQSAYLNYGLLGIMNLPYNPRGDTSGFKVRIMNDSGVIRVITDMSVSGYDGHALPTGTLIGIKLG